MEKKKMQEGVLAWGILYLGMLVGGLLVVGLMSFFLQRKKTTAKTQADCRGPKSTG